MRPLPESAIVIQIPAAVVVAAHDVIPAYAVFALYTAAGWWPQRTAEQLRAVVGSSPAVGAWHDDRLVRFAQAVTDCILHAYVEDVVVWPDRRGTRIGHALMDCLMASWPHQTDRAPPRLTQVTFGSTGF
jgi:hypothetical protein